MLRSHGMVREPAISRARRYQAGNPDLNPDFHLASLPTIPAIPRSRHHGAQPAQASDHIVKRRTENLLRFLKQIDPIISNRFQLEGSSNYAFNLILKRPMTIWCNPHAENADSGVEFRRGSAEAAPDSPALSEGHRARWHHLDSRDGACPFLRLLHRQLPDLKMRKWMSFALF